MAHDRYYLRLTRASSGLGTYTSLWLGPDHLLLVTSTGFTETYQRFYLRDIQAFVVTDTKTYTILNAITASLLLLFGVITLLNVALGRGVAGLILIPVVPVFLLLAWNLLRGPTCKVTLMSGVQSVVLPPLSRSRRVRKVFARLVPLVEAAQAALVPPTIAAPAAPAAPAHDSDPSAADSSAATTASPPPPAA